MLGIQEGRLWKWLEFMPLSPYTASARHRHILALGHGWFPLFIRFDFCDIYVEVERLRRQVIWHYDKLMTPCFVQGLLASMLYVAVCVRACLHARVSLRPESTKG